MRKAVSQMSSSYSQLRVTKYAFSQRTRPCVDRCARPDRVAVLDRRINLRDLRPKTRARLRANSEAASQESKRAKGRRGSGRADDEKKASLPAMSVRIWAGTRESTMPAERDSQSAPLIRAPQHAPHTLRASRGCKGWPRPQRWAKMRTRDVE